jgi:hypothetical protein
MSTLVFNTSHAGIVDSITPYANLTLWTAWDHKTEELGEGIVLLDEVEGTLRDRIDYQMDLTATASSFIGVTGTKNDVTVKAEVGVYPFTRHGSPTLTIRYLYGAYEFGPFELRGGYDMAPYQAINHNDVCDGEIFADAALFESFQPQVRLSAFGAYFQIMRSIVENTELYLDSGLVGIGVLTTIANTKTVIPKMALGYIYTAQKFSLGVHGIYQKYSIDEAENCSLDGQAITAAIGSIAMTGNFGPVSLHISGFVGQNPGEAGIFTNNNKNGDYTPFNGGANNKAKTDTAINLCNTLGYGFSVSGGLKIGFVQINAGIAYDRDENEVFKSPLCKSGIDDSYACFADVMFFIRENLRLVPTFKVVNYLNTAGNAFQSYDLTGRPIPKKVKEGVLTRFGFAFQASI